MKTKTSYKPTVSKFSILRQLCNLIPTHLVPKLARDTGVENQRARFHSVEPRRQLALRPIDPCLGPQ